MATEAVDISLMQDEDALRRMWQQTEDLSRKKEIRARMYKLREQRLREFYTTGEVLRDVQRATPDHFQNEIIELSSEEKSLVPVIDPTTKTMTHTDSIKDRGFMTMKSQEIRDSESPTRNYQVFQQGDRGGDSQSYWKVQSSSESYQAVGRDGQYEVTSQSRNRNMAGENGRVTVDSDYFTENKSVMDRNGDVSVISSRAYDSTGRDVSNRGGKGGDEEVIRRFSNSGTADSHFDDFNNRNSRFIQDVDDGQMVSRTSGSRSSETRMTSSSQVQRSSVQTHKTSSSTVTKSSTSDRFDQGGHHGFGDDVLCIDDANSKLMKEFGSGTNVSRRGVTEVKKTIIRGGKVITETVTYVDGKPVDGTTKTTTTTREVKGTPTETVTVIRGGKLIKETVPVKSDADGRRPSADKLKNTTNDDSRTSVQSFITTERFSTETHTGRDAKTNKSGRMHEPDDDYDDDVPRRQGTTTKTVIRSGKVVKEQVPVDIDETNQFIQRETSSTQKTKQHQSKKSVNRTSVTESTRRSEPSDNRRSREYPDEQNLVPRPDDYEDTKYVPSKSDQPNNKQPQWDDKPRSKSDLSSPVESDYDNRDVERKTTSGTRTTTTKTVTVIRGGKVMKQTVVESVDGNDVTDKKTPHGPAALPYDDDELPERDNQYPHDKGTRMSQPRDSDRPDKSDNVTRTNQVTSTTVKTVIRGGKLIKEAVPDEGDVHTREMDDDYPKDEFQRREKTPKSMSPGDRPERDETKPQSRRGKPDDRDKPMPTQPGRGKSPQHNEPDDGDDYDDMNDEPEGTIFKRNNKTETKKSTSKQFSTDVKTVTVIRGGKIIKEKVTVSDAQDTVGETRKPSEISHKTPQKKDVTHKTNEKPRKSPETDSRKSPSKKPSDKHPGQDIPSDKESSIYPSGSEAPDTDEEMPHKVVTVIRSGKLIKEIVPIVDDEEDFERAPNDSKTGKVTPGKRPSGAQPGKHVPDSRKPSDRDQPTKGKKQPEDRSFRRPESEPEEGYPDQNGKGNRPRYQAGVPKGARPSSPTESEPTGEKPKDHNRKPVGEEPNATYGKPRDRHVPDEDDYPSKRSPGDGDQRQPKEPVGSDAEERPVKTIKVIRSGKVYTETVEMTDDEIRERKLMDINKVQKATVPKPEEDDGDDDKPLGREKMKPEDELKKPHHGKSPAAKDSPNDVITDFIEHEKLQPVKTVTVIRSGKIVKEVIKDDRNPDEDEEPGRPSKKYPQKPTDGKPGDRQSPEKTGRKPGDSEPEDHLKRPQGVAPDRYSPEKSGRKPGDEPRRQSPTKSGKIPDENEKPQDEPSPDKKGRKPNEPGRHSPDKFGRHPGEDAPNDVDRQPRSRSPDRQYPHGKPGEPREHDRLSPEKMVRRPEHGEPDDFIGRPRDGRPDEFRPEEINRKPYDEEPDREPGRFGRPKYGEPDDFSPGRQRKHPEDNEPNDLGRRPHDGSPHRQHPHKTSERPQEPDERDEYPSRRPGNEPGRRSPGRQPGVDEPDQFKRRPENERPGSLSPERYGTHVPGSQSPDEHGKRPEDGQPDEFSPGRTGRRPSEDEPRHHTRKPHDNRPNNFGKQPDDEHPDEFSPTKSDRQPRKYPEDIEKTTAVKTVTVIRSGKIVKEVVPVDSDGDRPDPHRKTPENQEPEHRHPKKSGFGLPDDEDPRQPRRPSDMPDVRRRSDVPDDTYPDDYGRSPEKGYPDGVGRRPRDGEPEEYANRPDGSYPDDLTSGRPLSKRPTEPGKQPRYDEIDDYGVKPQFGSVQKPEKFSEIPDRHSPGTEVRHPDNEHPKYGEPDMPSSDKTPRHPYYIHQPGDNEKRPQDDDTDEYSPNKTGKIPGDRDRYSPSKTGRRPTHDDQPTGQSPTKMDKRPKDQGRQPLDAHDRYPRGQTPDKTGRKPGEPDQRFPEKARRQPTDEPQYGRRPLRDEYSPERTSGRPGEPNRRSPDKHGRYPDDHLPDDYSRKPKEVPDSRSPNKNIRRPGSDKPQEGRPSRYSPTKPGDDVPGRGTPNKSVRRETSPDGTTPKGKKPVTTKSKKPTDKVDRDVYQTDKISVDISASHAQFASSLRAPPLERPETPVKPYDDDQSSKPYTGTKSTPVPKQPRVRDTSPVTRDWCPRSSPSKGTPQRPKSPNDEPLYGRRPRRPDSPERITQRPSSKISDVISRLSSDTTSSRERRKLTSRNSRSIISKRTRTPGVSPHTSPSRGRPKTDKPHRRTSSASTSSISSERDSDFHYQQPEEPDEPKRYSVDESFIRVEREESRKTQLLTDYPEDSVREPRDRSPSDESSASQPRTSGARSPEKRHPSDKEYPHDRATREPSPDKPKSLRRPEDDDDDVDDYPRDKKPVTSRDDHTRPTSRRPTSSPDRHVSPSGRSRSPSGRSKPRDRDGRAPRSTSVSPSTSPHRRNGVKDSSPVGRRYPHSPQDDVVDNRKKPKAPEKLTPLQKASPDSRKKDPTKSPSQQRFPSKVVEPVKDKPKTPTGNTRPGDKPFSFATPGYKRPDPFRPKPDTTKPLKKPQNNTQNGTPTKPDTNKYPRTSPHTKPQEQPNYKPKSPTSVQQQKPKLTNGTVPAEKKPVGRVPSTGKVAPKGRRPDESDDEDIRKLTDYSTTTRRQTTTTVVQTKNLINSEMYKKPSTRKNIMDFDWCEKGTPDDHHPGSRTKTPKDKSHPLTDGRETQPSQPGTKKHERPQPSSPSSKSSKPRPKSVGTPSELHPVPKKPGKSQPGRKHPDRPGSESSDNESEVDIPEDVDFIEGERKPRRPKDRKDGKYTEEIDMITRERETTYQGTKVVKTSLLDTEDYTGVVELPDTSRESTRSPDVNRLKCVPVNENDTEEVRPRYADQVSEPEEETDMDYGRKSPGRTKKLPENAAKEEEPRKTLRDMVVKSALEKIDKIPDFGDADVTNETVNVSVAERVNKFMETALKPDTRQTSRPQDITLQGLDDSITEYTQNIEFGDDANDFHSPKSTSSVIKAKTMFETIANQTVTGTARRDILQQDDILSRPSVFHSKPATEKPKTTRGRKPSGRESDESPDRSRSPKSGDRPRDRDDSSKPRGTRPGSRETSPRRPGDHSIRSDRKPGDRITSPDRHRTSPTKAMDHRPDDDDDDDVYGRKPRRPQDTYGTPSRTSRNGSDALPKRPGQRPKDTTRSPDRGIRYPDSRFDDKVKPDRRDTTSPDRYGSKPKSPAVSDYPENRKGRPHDRETSPHRRNLYPNDKPHSSKPSSQITTDRPGTTPGEKPRNKALTPDRYGVVPTTTTGSPRRPGQQPTTGYPKGKTPYSSSSPTKGRLGDRDASPRRHGGFPDHHDTTKRPGQRPHTYEPLPTSKSKPSGTTSPGRDYPRSSSPVRKSEPRDRHGSPRRPDDETFGSTSPDRRSPTRSDRYDSHRPSDRNYSPDRRYSPDRSPNARDTSPSRRPYDYDSPGQAPTRKSPSKELADQVRRLSSPKKESPLSPSKYSYPKVSKPEPARPTGFGVVDKYSLMDYDKKTTTTTSSTKFSSTYHTSPLYPSRTSPDKQKPLSTTKQKPSGYSLPVESCRLSPTLEKTKKIPENSNLKAPALLKKQEKPDAKRYTTSVYQPLYDDDDDGERSPNNSIPRKKMPTTNSTDSKFFKFGVTLKKTTPGTNFIRKGPVDVGKKETELDRTYDLDILNAMLERAKGYEERRLIRGQIRNVKNMIEHNELLPRSSQAKKPVDDYVTYRPTSEYNGYEPNSYATYRSETTTETTSIRTSSPDRHTPREGTGTRRSPLRSTATLTLSPRGDTPLRRSPEKPSSAFPERKSPEKSYPTTGFRGDSTRPTTRKFEPDSEPVGRLIDSETRKHLRRSQSPKKFTPSKPFGGDDVYDFHPGSKPTYGVSKTIKETKETNITDSIISSYGVGPTDDKGRPLFGLQALRRLKGKPEAETDEYIPKEPKSVADITDSSGRAFFGLNALRSPKKDSEYPDDSGTRDSYSKHPLDSPRRGSPTRTTTYDEEFIRREMDTEEVNRLMSEPGQSLKDMIRKHERLMEDEERRPDKVTSYSTSTVIRSSAVRRPDGTVSVRKNVIRGETTAKDDEEPQTRVTTEEYSYETPDREPLDILDVDESGRKSITNITSRSSTSDSLQDRYRTTVTSSSLRTRKSLSPDRKSPERNFTSSRPSSRASVSDFPRRSRDEDEPKSPTSRKSISDRLTQLSRKFSNDSLDRNSDVRDITSDSSHQNVYTSRTSTYRSSVDGNISSFNESSTRYRDTENGKSDRRFSSSLRDDDSGLGYRRGSSTPIEDVKETLYRKFSGSEDVDHAVPSFTRVGKGGSVKALSQKFQQAAAEAETPKTGVSSYPKAGLILRSTSFKQTNNELLTSPDSPGLKQSISMEVRVGSPTTSGANAFDSDHPTDRSWSPGRGDRSGDDCSDRRTTGAQTTTETRSDGGNKSFLGNSSKVTGVQDIINRMRAADQETAASAAAATATNDQANDSQARALLNKFLGASVIMSGMEPLVKASGASSSTLVSQVERQRILDSPSQNGHKEVITTSESYLSDSDDIDGIWDEKKLRRLLDTCSDYEGRRKLRARLRTVMAEKSACEKVVAAAREDSKDSKVTVTDSSKSVHRQVNSDGAVSSRPDSGMSSSTRAISKSTFSTTATASSTNKPISPFAKFQQLDRQNSSSAPSSPGVGNAPLFTFTDPKLCRSASGAKDRLLQWCQFKTKNYKNVQIENFSTSWSNGLAFCALIHHFRPEAFDYDSLSPKERRKNFELAFRVAEEQANIAPLLDVEDMVMMKKPDWKCVFTYVQSIYHRFKNEEI